MLRDLKDMKLQRIAPADLHMEGVQTITKTALSRVEQEDELKKNAEQAYGAWLGFYNGNTKKCGWDKPTLVETANFFSSTLGLAEVPALMAKTIGMMGLKGVRGLRIEPHVPGSGGSSGGGGRGRRG